jgi:hypothetical protein
MATTASPPLYFPVHARQERPAPSLVELWLLSMDAVMQIPMAGARRCSCLHGSQRRRPRTAAETPVRAATWIPSGSCPRHARRNAAASSSSDALRCVALARSGYPPSICVAPARRRRNLR